MLRAMKPPADLPRELVFLWEAFGRKLGLTAGEAWAVLYGKAPKPPGWDEAFSEVFEPLSLTSDSSRTKDRYGMQPLRTGLKTTVGRPMENDHPFAVWLKAQRLSLTEWAFNHGFKRERVKSWIAEGDGGRPIPRAAADLIAVESTPPGKKRPAVPATAAVWTNGIKE
jgi:hypothetical protein